MRHPCRYFHHAVRNRPARPRHPPQTITSISILFINASSLTLVLVTSSILGDPSSVEEEVLRVRDDGRNQGHRHETQDGAPAGVVERGVALAEELASDDAGRVCRHDEDGHGDGSLTRGTGVEGHPGAVDGV